MSGRMRETIWRVGTVLQDAANLLREHKVRSSLTILGISVGIWAVVTLLGIGLGARGYIENQVQVMGSDLLVVSPGNARDPTTFFNKRVVESLTVDDARYLAREVEHARHVAPVYQERGKIAFGDQRAVGSLVGTVPDYLGMRDMEIAAGRPLLDSDIASGAAVGVLGAGLAERLFGNRPAIGRIIRFQGQPVEVIGVLEKREDSAFGDGQDDQILSPVSFVQRHVAGVRHVQYLMIEAASRENKPQVRRDVERYLTTVKRVPGTTGPVHTVTDFGEIASFAGMIVDAMTWILASIAGVSLVVGGIGVMNVMLASVSERVCEIGIRRAVGATAGQIKAQFLGEAALLTLLGGILGLLLSVLSLAIVGQFLPWSTVIDVGVVFGVMLFSTAIGGFFGYYPAHKASSLSPMEALRYD
ncbi:MAG: ABC transporter permease [Pseudomonadota bacterium]